MEILIPNSSRKTGKKTPSSFRRLSGILSLKMGFRVIFFKVNFESGSLSSPKYLNEELSNYKKTQFKVAHSAQKQLLRGRNLSIYNRREERLTTPCLQRNVACQPHISSLLSLGGNGV